jgi:ATP-binding cassette subfamily F protein 3
MMRMLSGVEAPDSGTRTEGHQVVMQYFAQDEATRLDPTLTIYQTLAGDAPLNMVPSIRNILGGFLFSGDDIEKPVRVLSGGERTRLAVARMLLRPSNTLLLDEPTNHLEDFGGTLIFVSHDRYFVDKLATKVIDIGGGRALMYPGTYEEYLWSRTHQTAPVPTPSRPAATPQPTARSQHRPSGKAAQSPKPTAAAPKKDEEARPPAPSYEDRKRDEAEARKLRKAQDTRRKRVEELEARIAEREGEIKEIEGMMSAAGFYDNHEAAKPVIDRHQALMWEVGDLMGQWETLQEK